MAKTPSLPELSKDNHHFSDCIIYQFSTGITVEGDATNFRSTGFTGEWMKCVLPNQTGQKVPSSIERAIKNGEFKARNLDDPQYPQSVKPAIIGRVVFDSTEIWSVVAIVTRIRDQGRKNPCNRYFFCKGDNLWILANWLSKQIKENNLPIFDPFCQAPKPIKINKDEVKKFDDKRKKIRQQFKTYRENNQSTMYEWIKDEQEKTMIIPPPDSTQYIQLSITQFHEVAQIKTELNQKNPNEQLYVSWAYNVEHLTRPELFTLIQPTTKEAYDSFQKIYQEEEVPSLFATHNAQIEEVLKKWIKNQIVKKNIDFIESIFSKQEENDETMLYWRKLGDKNSASDALNHDLLMEDWVEIVTLLPFFVPETFMDEYVRYFYKPQKWWQKLLSFFNSFQRKNIEQKKARTDKIQSSLRNYIQEKHEYPNIKNNLIEGLLPLVYVLRDNPELQPILVDLVGNNKKSIWNLVLDDVYQELDQLFQSQYEEYKKKKNIISPPSKPETLLQRFNRWLEEISDRNNTLYD
jgi:hypothetical protein